MVGRHDLLPARRSSGVGGCLANHGRPPGSPSNSFKISPSHPVTFSPTVRLRKSFSCNTYAFPRKCCKQKPYGNANSFGCNTYKKQGVGVTPAYVSLPFWHPGGYCWGFSTHDSCAEKSQ